MVAGERTEITEGSVASSYVPYKSDRRNAAAYNAEVPASAITINGISIDNSKEEYPLLSFRDVTYFPLTWRFAHDQFGWEYRWDDAEGLSIQSHNPQLLTPDLPSYAGRNDVTLYKGYYYFAETTGTTNQVYRAPVQSPSEKETVYSYNLGSDHPNPFLSFRIRDNELWFKYHVGGATMGGDVFVKVNDDGTAERKQFNHSYLDFRKTPYGTLIVDLSVPPSGNNLSLAAPGQEDQRGKAVGNPYLMYGWFVTVGDSSVGAGGADTATVIGDDVYIGASAYSYSEGFSDKNKIYKINLKTNETKKIVNAEVSHFRIIDNKLYYVKDADKALYSSALDGTGERKLSDNPVSWFDEIDGNVYYTSVVKEDTYRLYRADPEGEDPSVMQELVSSVKLFDGKLVCLLDEKEDYGALGLDRTGRLLLKVADPVSHILTSDDAILLASSGDSSIKFIR
jgi:hypothetical protein